MPGPSSNGLLMNGRALVRHPVRVPVTTPGREASTDRSMAFFRPLEAFGRNGMLRRIELASVLWNVAEQLYLVGLLVFAHAEARNIGVASVAVIQTVLPLLALPLLLRWTGRMQAASQLRWAVAARVVAVGGAAVALVSGAPFWLVLGLAGLDAVAAALARPTRSALLPQIATTPQELVGSNVWISTGRSLASLVGPAVAAVLLVVADITSTFAVACAVLVVALLITATIRGTRPIVLPHTSATTRASSIRVLRQLRYPRTVVAVVAAQQVTRHATGPPGRARRRCPGGR